MLKCCTQGTILVFVLTLTISNRSQAQALSIALPNTQNSIQKPASDLLDPRTGQVIDPGLAASWAEQGRDLSLLNPTNSKMWQKEPLSALSMSQLNYPTGSQGVRFLNIEASTRYTVLARVQSAANPNLYFRLGISRLTQPMLMRAALLRKLGYPLPSPKNYTNLTLRFSSEEQKKSFLDEAQQSVGDFESRHWITSQSTTDHSVVFSSASLEVVSSDYFDLQWGLAPNPDDPSQLPIVQRFSRNRAYRALIIPYSLVDVPESVNRYSGQYGTLASGHVVLNYPMANSFASCTFADARWVLRKIQNFTFADFQEIVSQSGYPSEIEPLVLAKLLHRAEDALRLFQLQVPASWPELPLQINSNSGLVKNGKVTAEFVAGYPQRFSHGDRSSPYEEGDFGRYLKVEMFTSTISSVLEHMNQKLQVLTVGDLAQRAQDQTYQRLLDQFMKNPTQPLHQEVTSWGGFFGGLNLNTSRHVSTGTYYGSTAAVQLVDNISVSAGLGYFRGLSGLDYFPSAGGNLNIVRDYTHVRPIFSIKEGAKVTWENLILPRFMRNISSVLRSDKIKKSDGTEQGSIDAFLGDLREGEVFTVTDSVALSAYLQASASLDVLLGITPFNYINSVTLGADGARVILRQTQFVKTGRGVQIFIREMKNKAAGLEMNINFFLQLLKIRSQLTESSVQSLVYNIDYSPELLSSITDPEAPKAKELLQTRENLRLTLLPLFKSNDLELLEAKFKSKKFTLQHNFLTKELKSSFMAKRFASFKEEHSLDLLYPRSEKHPELDPEDEKVSLYGVKQGELVGRDLLGFFFDFIGGVLSNRNSQFSIARQFSNNPSNVPFGRAKWRIVNAEADVSEKIEQHPSVAMIQHVWGGWKIDRSGFLNIVSEIEKSFSALDQRKVPFINLDAFQNMKSLDFYRVTQNLSILDGGLVRIRNLITQPESNGRPVAAVKNPLMKLFKKISEAGRNKARPNDREMFEDVLRVLGNGDYQAGLGVYLDSCRAENTTNAGEVGPRQISGEAWHYGSNYECLSTWMTKLLELSRRFPSNDKKAQSRWLVEVLRIIDDKIPTAQLLNYLGEENYVFVVRINGFRSGDEDGDLEYFSNTSGDPKDEIEYANGLFQMYGKKTRIMPNELDKTLGGFQ